MKIFALLLFLPIIAYSQKDKGASGDATDPILTFPNVNFHSVETRIDSLGCFRAERLDSVIIKKWTKIDHSNHDSTMRAIQIQAYLEGKPDSPLSLFINESSADSLYCAIDAMERSLKTSPSLNAELQIPNGRIGVKDGQCYISCGDDADSYIWFDAAALAIFKGCLKMITKTPPCK